MITAEIHTSIASNIFSKQPPVQIDGRWYRALDLEERVLTLSRRAALLRVDDRLGERRLVRWHSQPPFADEALFERRLALAGVTPELFRALLGETPKSLAERADSTPPWLVEIEHAWAEPFEPVPWPDGTGLNGDVSLSLAEPFVGRAWRRLAAALEDVTRCLEAPFDSHLAAWEMLAHLPAQLAQMLGPVLTEEGLARACLHGPDQARDFLCRYPVLAREIIRRIGQWENTSFEMLTHLAADADSIRQELWTGQKLGTLAETQPLSEPQGNGRRGYELRFDSGLRLVYQPRSMALDRAFQNLLRWVGERGFAPAFCPLTLIDRGDHGWRRFVEESPCPTRREARRFHQRQGGYLALLDVLGGHSFRPARLIAAGEHPTLIDFETLFHPPRDLPAGARGLAKERPRLDEYGGEISGHAADLREGFHRLSRLLIRHREELLDPGGPMAAFSGAEVRVRVRPAAEYTALSAGSFDPALLGDALERQRHFDQLWADAAEHSVRASLVPLEDADLRRGDQPLFTSRPGSRDLWGSRGERFRDFFAESALAGVKRRLARLAASDPPPDGPP